MVSSSRWVYDQADRDIDLKHTVDLQFGGLCSGSGQNVIADRLSKVEGVAATSTHIAFRTYSRHDLEAAFSLGLD